MYDALKVSRLPYDALVVAPADRWTLMNGVGRRLTAGLRAAAGRLGQHGAASSHYHHLMLTDNLPASSLRVDLQDGTQSHGNEG